MGAWLEREKNKQDKGEMENGDNTAEVLQMFRDQRNGLELRGDVETHLRRGSLHADGNNPVNLEKW